MKKQATPASKAAAANAERHNEAAARKAASRFVRAVYYRQDGSTREVIFQTPKGQKASAPAAAKRPRARKSAAAVAA